MANPYMGGYNYGQYYNPLQPQMDRLVQMQTQYQQQQPQVPQTNQGILWVQGEAGAKSYLVAPNTSVLLMDSENERFYIKTTDSAGMPTPLRTFEYKEVGVNAPEPQKQPEINLDDKYVTRQEYNDLRGKYEELYGLLELTTKPISDNHRKGE